MLEEYHRLLPVKKDQVLITAMLGVIAKSSKPNSISVHTLKAPPQKFGLKEANRNQLSWYANGLVNEWRIDNNNAIPQAKTLQALLNVHAKQSAVGPLLDTFRLLNHYYPKDELRKTYGILIDACAQRQPKPHIRLMEKAFNVAVNQKKIHLSHYIFGSMFAGYARAGKIELMTEMLETMESKYEVRPNAILYSHIIDAFGKAGRVDEMMMWFAKLRKAKLEQPDHIVYNTMITAFGKAGKLDHMIDIYYALIEGLENGSIQHNSLSELNQQQLKRMRSWRRPKSDKFLTISNDPAAAKNEMITTYKTMLEAFVNQGEFGRVVWVYDEMTKRGIPHDSVATFFLSPNLICFLFIQVMLRISSFNRAVRVSNRRYGHSTVGKRPVLTETVQVIKGESGDFTSKLVSKVDLFPGQVLASLEAMTPTDVKRYSTVQTGPDSHVELNSDLLYMNHSCDPNVVLDTDFGVVAAAREIKKGDAITFFYPSTEWDMDQPFQCWCGSPKCLKHVRGAKHIDSKTLNQFALSRHIREMKKAQV
ncbi:hypothetical protein HDU99_000893 [Rhizoclosmatium hyalinum]|nr:hypothetical protein HDU99_000893 [Rhizoclosmatium hyalinum]